MATIQTVWGKNDYSKTQVGKLDPYLYSTSQSSHQLKNATQKKAHTKLSFYVIAQQPEDIFYSDA